MILWILVGLASWVSVFAIAWLEILGRIPMWPSGFYVIAFGVVGLLALGGINVTKSITPEKPTESPKVQAPPPGRVKGLK